MKLNNVKRMITGLFVLVVLMVGIGSTTADAYTGGRRRVVIVRHYDPFWHHRYDPFYYGPRVNTVAYQQERGYSEGKDQGEKDAKKGRPADPKAQKEYRKSDSKAFRNAFVEGYEEGYDDKSDKIGDNEGE